MDVDEEDSSDESDKEPQKKKVKSLYLDSLLHQVLHAYFVFYLSSVCIF